MRPYVCVYVRRAVYICVYVSSNVRVRVNIFVFLSVCTCSYMHVHMHACNSLGSNGKCVMRTILLISPTSILYEREHRTITITQKK